MWAIDMMDSRMFQQLQLIDGQVSTSLRQEELLPCFLVWSQASVSECAVGEWQLEAPARGRTHPQKLLVSMYALSSEGFLHPEPGRYHAEH